MRKKHYKTRALLDSVYAEFSTKVNDNVEYDAEDTADILFAYNNWLDGTLILFRYYPQKTEYIKVAGNRVIVEFGRGKITSRKSNGEVVETLHRKVAWPTVAIKQIDYFCKAIEGERENFSNSEYNLQHISFVEACYLSKYHSWYAFVFNYISEKLHHIPIERFYEALRVEGCEELDKPGSTRPLNYHPLFQHPEELPPYYKGRVMYKVGDFTSSGNFHETSLKLLVWYQDSDKEIIDMYLKAIEKVIQNHEELIC